MSFNKKERRFWKTKFSFGSLANIPQEMEHLNLRDEYFSNEELCFITSRIKRIARLDLDSNPIDDEGIDCLKKLDYIKELRLKGLEISNKSVLALAKLHSIEFLHLGSTGINCEALPELARLENLKRLIIQPELADEQKIQEFRKKRPDCELNVNPNNYLNKI